MAYQIVIYDESNVIADKVGPIENVAVEGNSVSWNGGGLDGIQFNFIVIDAAVLTGDPGDTLDQSVIDQDQKANLRTKYDQLRHDIATLQDVINFLLGL